MIQDAHSGKQGISSIVPWLEPDLKKLGYGLIDTPNSSVIFGVGKTKLTKTRSLFHPVLASIGHDALVDCGKEKQNTVVSSERLKTWLWSTDTPSALFSHWKFPKKRALSLKNDRLGDRFALAAYYVSIRSRRVDKEAVIIDETWATA
jgi:hypothetical protein